MSDHKHPSGLSPSDSSVPVEPPTHEGFEAAEEHPLLDTNHGPTIAKEDPERLEQTRVDQEDEVIARYDPATDREIAVLRTKDGEER